MLRELTSSVARHGWLRKAVVTTPGVRSLAWRFIAGEDLGAALAAVRGLNGRGIQATLNPVGTHVREARAAEEAAEEAIAAVRGIRDAQLGCNVSVKLTAIGLDVGEDFCRERLRGVLEAAAACGVFVRIDMEESAYVDRTLRLFEEARDRHGADAVGIVVQSYLKHRASDLDRLIAGGSRIRLVKGGYWESPDVVHRRRRDIDDAFLRDVERLLPHGRHPAIATHDPSAIARARRVAADAGLVRDGFELQMLYGVREDLQSELVREGCLVRSYVPYGTRWYEYFLGCARRVPGGALRRVRDRLRPARLG